MQLFGMTPIKAFYSSDSWSLTLADSISQFLVNAIDFVAVVVVNDTLASEGFQNCIQRIPSDSLFFVGDECHHHSSSVWLNRIPIQARFRVGLSATPWNPGRTEHQQILERLYGPVVSTYTLSDALSDKVLCPYVYEYVPCEFDSDEADEYVKLSTQMGSLMAQQAQTPSESLTTQLQIISSRRNRLLGSLRDKARKLEALLSKCERHPHTLIYCGEGQHPLDSGTTNQDRNIEQITQYLSNSGWKVGRVTASESMSQRERILNSFDDGFIEAIAAIRVLDEGFDIPSCRTAFILASSNSYRQYVQRRGRVLRKAHGKTHAHIYDFVALPSTSLQKSNPDIWKRQVEIELTRVRDFVNLAQNADKQQLEINNELQARGLGAIYYSSPNINEDDLYGN